MVPISASSGCLPVDMSGEGDETITVVDPEGNVVPIISPDMYGFEQSTTSSMYPSSSCDDEGIITVVDPQGNVVSVSTYGW
ncbi:hypothetical protein EV121DRAFT_286785 [Schizophyllum commune]